MLERVWPSWMAVPHAGSRLNRLWAVVKSKDWPCPAGSRGDELLRRTNHTVTDWPTADTLLRGEIRSASRRLLGRSTESGLPSALRLEITLNVEWVDLASGTVLKSLRNVRIAADYAPGGVGVTPGGERETVARQQLFRRTARTVVDALQSDW